MNSEGPYILHVTADGSDSVSPTVEYISVSGHTYTVINTPGVALPSTGSSQTLSVLGTGAAMTVLSSALLLRSRKRKREDEEKR